MKLSNASPVNLGAEFPNELQRRAHGVEGRNFEQPDVVKPADNTFVLVLGEQRLQHRAGLRTVLGEHIALLDVHGASCRESGGWSKAMWQIRSKGSRSLPISSRQGSSRRPSSASSSMIASFRSANFQACEKLF